MSPKGKMIFVAVLVLLVAGTFGLKALRQPAAVPEDLVASAEGPLPVFLDIMTPT